MNVKENLKKLGHGILDLVFPISCLVCGKDSSYLCAGCIPKLSKLEHQQCLVCQRPSPFGKTHPECISRNSVDGIISALSYKDKTVKKIIETMKYNFVSDLARPLADLINEEVKKHGLGEYFSDFIIIPVPLHQRRFNWRGFNQASLLAKSLKEKLNNFLDEKLILRIRYTQPQTTLSQQQRKTNVVNAFNVIASIQGKKFLIVDDVVTTGSTINEIAKLLKRQGASEVWGLTAAKG